MMKGEYIGARDDLKGKRALLQQTERPYVVLAQFDDIATGLGYGWHGFIATNFRIDQPS